MPVYQTAELLDENREVIDTARWLNWASGNGELIMWTDQTDGIGVGSVLRIVHADYSFLGRVTGSLTKYEGQQTTFFLEKEVKEEGVVNDG